jgi:hypothetical protein
MMATRSVEETEPGHALLKLPDKWLVAGRHCIRFGAIALVKAAAYFST